MIPAMSGQESDHLWPLCPAHYERMVISPARLESIVLPTTWTHEIGMNARYINARSITHLFVATLSWNQMMSTARRRALRHFA